MLPIVALLASVSLFLAFIVAPFQHVHPGRGVIHAHFYPVHSEHAEHHGPRIEADDDHESARSLDMFQLVLTAGLSPFLPSAGPILLFVPSEPVQTVERIEERAHAPPLIDRSIPRAPPA